MSRQKVILLVVAILLVIRFRNMIPGAGPLISKVVG